MSINEIKDPEHKISEEATAKMEVTTVDPVMEKRNEAAAKVHEETPSEHVAAKSEGAIKREVATERGAREDYSYRNFPWKKELKLKGRIGDPKDTGPGKVTYLSLIRQIEKWVKQKKHTEEEICDTVIEAILSELPLRSMLEGKFDLNIARLRRFLRCHYEEEEATQVYKDLTLLKQRSSLCRPSVSGIGSSRARSRRS